MTRTKQQEDVVEETPAETVELFNPNEGLFGRDGGPYLDDEQALVAEIRRAQIEKREPDFDNPPPTHNTPLVRKATLIQNYNNTLIAGDDSKDFDGEVTAPVKAEVPVEAYAVPEEEVTEEEQTENQGLNPDAEIV